MGYTSAMASRETRRITPASEHAQSGSRGRTHLLIWSIALAVMFCAIGLVVIRGTLAPQNGLLDDPAQLFSDALAAVDRDPSLSEASTQTLVRAAAALAVATDQESAEGDYLLAMQYRQERNLNAAEAMFKRAIARRANWSRPHAGLGALLGRNTVGRLTESEEELRRAIELDPEWSQPWDDLAVILRIAARPEEAETAARRAVILAPGAVAPHNNLANLLVELGHYREAEEYFLEAIKLSPEHPKPAYNLACLYSLLQRDEEAIARLRSAIDGAEVLRNEAAVDPDFDPIRENPAFQQLVFGITKEESADASGIP